MRFAIQSIVFGKDVKDLPAMCRDIRKAGYRGVELFQDFKNDCYGNVAGIRDAMIGQNDKESIALVGVAGGALAERIEFVKDYSRLEGLPVSHEHAPYVYVDEWHDQCVAALESGVRIGLHPHMFRSVQTIREAADWLKTFERFPGLQLLPDTAHMKIAGDDPVLSIKEHLPRIGAIHLKDWNPNVGRSYQFYSSGFCPLGEGRVPLVESLRVLWFNEFKGWVVIEHDHSSTPFETIQGSMTWLRNPSNLPPYVLQKGNV